MPGAAQHPDLTLILGGVHAGRHAYGRSLAEAMSLPTRSLGWRDAPEGETLPQDLSPADAVRRHRTPATLLLLADISPWFTEAADLLAAIDATDGPLISVSREAGLGIVPIDAAARHGRDDLGRMNQALAARAGRVILVAAGLPLTLKGAS